MNDETPNIAPTATPPLPPSTAPSSGKGAGRKRIIIVIVAVVVVIGLALALTLVLSSGKKSGTSNKAAQTPMTQAQRDTALVNKLKSLNSCSLLTGNVLTQNSLSIDQVGNVGLDDHDYPHCVWQSVVNNQLQYEVETTIIATPVNDILVPTPDPIGGKSKVGSHQTYLTLGDYGNGHGVCTYNIQITGTARVELEARNADDTFEAGCNLANQYGPLVEQALTAKGF